MYVLIRKAIAQVGAYTRIIQTQNGPKKVDVKPSQRHYDPAYVSVSLGHVGSETAEAAGITKPKSITDEQVRHVQRRMLRELGYDPETHQLDFLNELGIKHTCIPEAFGAWDANGEPQLEINARLEIPKLPNEDEDTHWNRMKYAAVLLARKALQDGVGLIEPQPHAPQTAHNVLVVPSPTGKAMTLEDVKAWNKKLGYSFDMSNDGTHMLFVNWPGEWHEDFPTFVDDRGAKLEEHGITLDSMYTAGFKTDLVTAPEYGEVLHEQARTHPTAAARSPAVPAASDRHIQSTLDSLQEVGGHIRDRHATHAAIDAHHGIRGIEDPFTAEELAGTATQKSIHVRDYFQTRNGRRVEIHSYDREGYTQHEWEHLRARTAALRPEKEMHLYDALDRRARLTSEGKDSHTSEEVRQTNLDVVRLRRQLGAIGNQIHRQRPTPKAHILEDRIERFGAARRALANQDIENYITGQTDPTRDQHGKTMDDYRMAQQGAEDELRALKERRPPVRKPNDVRQEHELMHMMEWLKATRDTLYHNPPDSSKFEGGLNSTEFQSALDRWKKTLSDVTTQQARVAGQIQTLQHDRTARTNKKNVRQEKKEQGVDVVLAAPKGQQDTRDSWSRSLYTGTVKVTSESHEAVAVLSNLLGGTRRAAMEKLPEIMGAPAGSHITVRNTSVRKERDPDGHSNKYGNKVFIDLHHPYISSCTAILMEDSQTSEEYRENLDSPLSELYIDILRAQEGAPKGFGTRLFAKMAKGCKRNGLSRITLFAYGEPDTRDWQGYYFWPLVGFDGDLTNYRHELPEEYEDCGSLNELFSRKGGSEWWKNNGASVHAEFDLSPGATGWYILNEYLSKKQIDIGKAWNKQSSQSFLDLDEDDEKILRELWEARARS